MKISFIAIVGLFLSTTALAAPKLSPTETIRQANDTVRTLLAKSAAGDEANVTSELRGLFDIGDLAKRALVDHWDKDMSPAQRTTLVDTLRQIVERNYIAQLRSNLKYEIVYVGEEPQGSDVLVKTIVKADRKGRPVEIPVDYLLHADGDHWSAYDVITDEVSLLDNYRSQFNKIIAKDGVDGLLKRMKSKLEKNAD